MELDEALVKITEQNDTIVSLQEEIRRNKEALQEKEKETQRLRENNMKLFLRVQGGEEQIEDDEEMKKPEIKQTFDDFIKDWDIQGEYVNDKWKENECRSYSSIS